MLTQPFVSSPVHVSCAGSVSTPCDRPNRLRVLRANVTPTPLYRRALPSRLSSSTCLPRCRVSSAPFRLRLSALSGFPRTCLNIRGPCGACFALLLWLDYGVGLPSSCALLSQHATP